MAKLIHWVAIAACVVVVLGFAGFAADEMRFGSETQQAKLAEDLNTPSPSTTDEQKRAREHTKAREVIDDANDVLLAPFSDLVHSKNIWVTRGVPTLLALLTYGLLVLLVANSLPKAKPQGGDWRAASDSS
jgi:hypothetical protein